MNGGDFLDKAAPAVLALDDHELLEVAVPLMRPESREERVLESLALLERARREARERPVREREYRDLLAYFEHEVDRFEHADAFGFGKRIAALVRARDVSC